MIKIEREIEAEFLGFYGWICSALMPLALFLSLAVKCKKGI